MAIKKHKPTSPGRRFATYSDHAEVTKNKPEKSLTEGLKKSGGRNAHGRITSRHRGGGAKRQYRKIDFKRAKDGVPAKVAAIEYDPNRTAYIALLHYADGEKAYILAPGAAEGRRHGVSRAPDADITAGNCLPLANIPTGTTVHNVELTAGPRRPDGPLRRHRDPARGQGGRLRHPAPALGRDAHGARRVPRLHRRDRQRRAPEHRRSARPAARATRASARRRAARR